MSFFNVLLILYCFKSLHIRKQGIVELLCVRMGDKVMLTIGGYYASSNNYASINNYAARFIYALRFLHPHLLSALSTTHTCCLLTWSLHTMSFIFKQSTVEEVHKTIVYSLANNSMAVQEYWLCTHLPGSAGPINCLAFTQDGKFLASGGMFRCSMIGYCWSGCRWWGEATYMGCWRKEVLPSYQQWTGEMGSSHLCEVVAWHLQQWGSPMFWDWKRAYLDLPPG